LVLVAGSAVTIGTGGAFLVGTEEAEPCTAF
jgi:hypothetical protein